MKKSVLLGTGILATALLTGCGGSSSGGAEIQKFSVGDLTPVEGTESIVGTWVGAADYVETGSGTYTIDGSDTEYPYTETYTGSRLVTVLLSGDDVNGYSIISCEGGESAVNYEASTATVTVLGRELQMTGYNQMTGTSDQEEWSQDGSENWNWVKVSGNQSNIGSFGLDVSNSGVTVAEYNTDLLSLCRESYSYSSSDGDTSSGTLEKGAHRVQGSSIKSFSVYSGLGNWVQATLTLLSNISFTSDDNALTRTVKNSSETAFSVDYAGVDQGADVKGVLRLSL